MATGTGPQSPAPGSQPDIFIGRQPIVDRSRSLVAFELLFRATDPAAPLQSNVAATAQVIINAFAEFGVEDTLGPHRGFINVDRELLMSDVLAVLPPNRIVLELLETIDADDEVVARCKALRTAGYRLALDDVCAFDTRVKKLLPYVDMIKFDVMATDEAVLARFASALSRMPLLLLAEKVETPERAEQCLQLGFHLFQGYHFARPQVLEGKRAPAPRIALLRLTQLLMSDADTSALENELKQHPELVYNLLRIVNSAAFGFSRQIDSLAQCITVLGHTRLARWAQLFLYAPSGGGAEAGNPLMQMAATRGKWMENLATALRPADKPFQDLAFMVGILSLLGALLGMRLENAIGSLNLSDEATSALLDYKGPLGAFLRLIELKEGNDFTAVGAALQGMPYLTSASFTAAELSAAAWAQSLASA